MSTNQQNQNGSDDQVTFLFSKSNRQYKINVSTLHNFPDSLLTELYNTRNQQIPESYIKIDAIDTSFPILLKMMKNESVDLNSYDYYTLKQLIMESQVLSLHLWKQFKVTYQYKKCKELQYFIQTHGGKIYKNSKSEKKEVNDLFFEEDCILDFSNSRMDYNTVDEFCVLLEQCNQPNYKHINLEKCYIGTEGLHRFSTVLKTYGKEIITLNLAYNNLTSESIRSLSETIGNNSLPNLMNLDLSANYLGPEGIRILFSPQNTKSFQHLKRLNLAYNELTSKGCKTISQYLQSGNLLQLLSLNLSYNNIGAKGMKHLCDALKTKHNTKLSELYLNLNCIGREGGHALSEALIEKACTQLRILELNDNELCKEGVTEIHNTLLQGCCPVLANISLKYNYSQLSSYTS